MPRTAQVDIERTYSVVVPAYNAEKTIDYCLASVIAQTLAPIEVLVVDDHSLDGTAAAVQRWVNQFSSAGIRLKYFCLDHNSGPSVARNKAIYTAKGSFIAFLDADDLWHKDKLAIVDRFSRASIADLVCHSYTEKIVFDVSTSYLDYTCEFVSISKMLLRNHAATPCTVIRKQHWVRFNESMSHCEDYDLWLRIAEISPILRLVGPPLTRLGRPPLTPGGLSGDTVKMRIGEVKVYYNFCRRAWLTRGWLLPGLLILSLLKHLYSRILKLSRQLQTWRARTS